VSTPGLLSAECKTGTNGSQYLAITVHGDPNDARVDDIVGDVIGADGSVTKEWGLHVIDMHMTMGNLVDIVKAKGEAFTKK
jgi:hypothetical protein